MAKSCYSYSCPLFGLLVLIFSDIVFTIINFWSDDDGWNSYALVGAYNILVAMAVWAHLTAMLSDPGFVPLGYSYDQDFMLPIDLSLFKFVTLNKDCQLEVEPGMSFAAYKTLRKTQVYQLKVEETGAGMLLKSQVSLEVENLIQQQGNNSTERERERTPQTAEFVATVLPESQKIGTWNDFQVCETESIDNNDFQGSSFHLKARVSFKEPDRDHTKKSFTSKSSLSYKLRDSIKQVSTIQTIEEASEEDAAEPLLVSDFETGQNNEVPMAHSARVTSINKSNETLHRVDGRNSARPIVLKERQAKFLNAQAAQEKDKTQTQMGEKSQRQKMNHGKNNSGDTSDTLFTFDRAMLTQESREFSERPANNFESNPSLLNNTETTGGGPSPKPTKEQQYCDYEPTCTADKNQKYETAKSMLIRNNAYQTERFRQMTLNQKFSINLNEAEFNSVKEKYLKQCNLCDAEKPPRVHHCRQCGRCILRMDHHCPWISNCVGLRNQKAFLLFTFYVCLVCLFTVVNMTFVCVRCYLDDAGDGLTCRLRHNMAGADLRWFALAIVIIATFFGLFTLALFIDQVNLIRRSTSTIDQKKGGKRSNANAVNNNIISMLPKVQRETCMQRLNQVMGRGGFCNILWMFPMNMQGLICIEDELAYKII